MGNRACVGFFDPHRVSPTVYLHWAGDAIPGYLDQLKARMADEALEAFWQVIVQRHPQAETGDLSPCATITLQTAAENAIAEWVNNNVPQATTKED